MISALEAESFRLTGTAHEIASLDSMVVRGSQDGEWGQSEDSGRDGEHVGYARGR